MKLIINLKAPFTIISRNNEVSRHHIISCNKVKHLTLGLLSLVRHFPNPTTLNYCLQSSRLLTIIIKL